MIRIAVLVGQFGLSRVNFLVCFMRLSQSHNSNHGFNGLTWVDSICFLYPFLIHFFSTSFFNNGLIVELGFIICFNLLFKQFSRSRYSGCELDILAQVGLGYFFLSFIFIYVFFQSHHSILD